MRQVQWAGPARSKRARAGRKRDQDGRGEEASVTVSATRLERIGGHPDRQIER
jgi:hypothetical protein